MSIGPEEFIPIAEEANLISALGRFVMYEACARVGEWNRKLPADEGLAVSVNISSRQFMEDDFIDMVKDACSKGGISPSDLILEITENTMLNNTELIIRRLEAIDRMGIRLAIDDFGTGYSSLSYLHKFPISILKIDRSFINTITDREKIPAIVRGLLDLGRTLQLETVAEGIESDAQLGQLRDQHCELGQGYLFARPLPAHEAEQLLGVVTAAV